MCICKGATVLEVGLGHWLGDLCNVKKCAKFNFLLSNNKDLEAGGRDSLVH